MVATFPAIPMGEESVRASSNSVILNEVSDRGFGACAQEIKTKKDSTDLSPAGENIPSLALASAP